MDIIVSTLCMGICYTAFKREKNIYNPITIFAAIWSVIIFGASLRLFGIYEPTKEAKSIIYIGVFSFLFGCLFYKVLNRKLINTYKISKEEVFDIPYRKIYCLYSIAIIIFLIKSIQSIELLFQGYDLYYIRYLAESEESIKSLGVFDILYAYIAKPIVYLIIPISAVSYFSKKDKKLTVFTILIIILQVLTDGGRFILLYFIFHYVFSFYIFNQKIRISAKQKRRIVIMITLLTIAIIYITISRGSSIFYNLYTYTVGCVPHLSVRIEKFKMTNLYTYGCSSMQGFIRPFLTILEKIGLFESFPLLVSRADFYTTSVEDLIYIGNGIPYNAFVTIFYYFYLDMGILGVIIGSFAYGYISYKIYINMKRKFILKNIVLYLMIIKTILTSMVRFQFTHFIFGLSIIYIHLLFLKVKIKYDYKGQDKYSIKLSYN